MEALRDLADDFNVRDPRKLYRLARQRDLDVTQTCRGAEGQRRFVRCTASAGSPVQRGELVAQVCRHHKVPVVPRQLLWWRGPPSRRSCSEDVHHHQAILRLSPRVLAAWRGSSSAPAPRR